MKYRRCIIVVFLILHVGVLPAALNAGDKFPALTRPNKSPKLVYAGGLGICYPLGQLAEFYSAGLAFGGSIGFSLPQTILEFRLDIGFDQVKVPGVWFGTPTRSGDMKTYGGALQMLVKVVRTGRIVPYGMIGVGPYRMTSDISDDYSGDTSTSGTKTGVSFGIGTKMLWSKFGLFVEYRFLELGESKSLSRFWLGYTHR